MKTQFSVIDLSALDRRRLQYIAAMRDIHNLLDPHWPLRMYMGRALAPEPRRIAPLGDGLFAVVSTSR